MCSKIISANPTWGRAGALDSSAAGMQWGQSRPPAEQTSWPATGAAGFWVCTSAPCPAAPQKWSTLHPICTDLRLDSEWSHQPLGGERQIIKVALLVWNYGKRVWQIQRLTIWGHWKHIQSDHSHTPTDSIEVGHVLYRTYNRLCCSALWCVE